MWVLTSNNEQGSNLFDVNYAGLPFLFEKEMPILRKGGFKDW